MNLLEETIDCLQENGKLPDEVLWVGNGESWMTWDEFSKAANAVEYEKGHEGSVIDENLVVAGENWWLERCECDGWTTWEFKKHLTRPTSHKIFNVRERVYWEDDAK